MRSSSNRHNAMPRRSVRKLLENLICGENDRSNPKRGRLMLESLENRQLLAGDMELLFTDGNPQPESAVQTGGLQVAGQAEGELAPDLRQFAIALGDAGVEFFGADWCPACNAQKKLFADGKDNLPFIEVTNPDRSLNALGMSEQINQFPTWKFSDGTVLVGVQTLETLSQTSGVPIPQSEQPTFEPIGNTTVAIGSPLHIPIDVYDPDFDPDGAPISVTVSVDDPSLVEASVLSGNRSINIDVNGFGDMVFELFEQRAPDATGRVIELADQPVGFYEGIIFHRVIDNFVIQGGDPTGTGSGGSSLGDFDDDFHPDLVHNREGILSFAKSGDDTNDSQFFVTEVATRHLDFNHSVFGQLVEGFDVRQAISRTSTTASRPDVDVVINSIDVFNDKENSVVMLKAAGNSTGTTNVTITVTDQDGNTHSETIQVTVTQDNANSQPFLDDIPAQATRPNTAPATLQLTSIDVEDDAVTYFGQSLSAASSGTVAVDSATGVVTVTPTAGFVGTIDVRVGVAPGPDVVGNGAGDMDTQTVPFVFETEGILAPTSIDLLTGSDSGTSNIDNITNSGSLSFLVDGVSDGATVELVIADGTVVGAAVATGNSVLVTTANIAALGDGSYQIAARQSIGNDTSLFSPTITVVYDSTAPDSVVSNASTQGNVDREYQTDLNSSEEGSGLQYSLASAPTGAIIDATTGVINWTPTENQIGPNTFTIELADLAGNVHSESFTVDVGDAPLAEIKLEVTDLQGNPITSIAVGQTFLLNFIGIDARSGFDRPPNFGVFQAYADILFDSSLIRPESGSAIDYSDLYAQFQRGTFETGLIDELGALGPVVSGGTKLEEAVIATIRMETLASGTANIRSEPSEQVAPGEDVLLYGTDDKPAVAFGSVSLAIGQSFTVGDDMFTINEDSGANVLDVLNNDDVVLGTDVLSVDSVTQPSSGGTVSLDGGVVRFTPAADFHGTAEFTYVVSDSGGIQDEGSVTVTVSPVNDQPTANPDSFTVDQDSTANSFDLISNDLIDPDTGDPNEDVTIASVGGTTGGGTVTIASDGKSVTYTPAAGFTGTDTFTYTIRDRAANDNSGLTDSSQVTVTVETPDNPPTAVADAFPIAPDTILEDTSEAAYDVLANDLRDGDNQSFVISSVGTPSQGGSVRFSTDGTQFFYTPAADFAGTETVTYTIRDTGGGLSVGTATFTVNGVNDAPPILNPTVQLVRGAGETVVFELDDLPDNVDSGETLLISTVSTTTSAGGTALNDGSTIRYTPPSDEFSGQDTITYSISDGNGGTNSGTITINVAEFQERDIFLNLALADSFGQINGIVLEGTNLLGNSVEVPLRYGVNSASFDNLLPGSYTITIPAIPFFQNATAPRAIQVTSAADDGDTSVDAAIGRLKPEFISIRDWLGSVSRNSILVAVSPGESSLVAMKSSGASTIHNPVAQLDSAGNSLTIEGSVPETDPVVAVVPETVNPGSDSQVQSRGEVNGVQLLKISNLEFDSSDASSAAEGEGELFIAEDSTLADPTVGLTANGVGSSILTVGDVQAEGESIATSATTRADIFVPAANNDSSRTDATVLALEEGDLWLGQSLQSDSEAPAVVNSSSVDSAMQSVSSELTLLTPVGDEIAENSAVSASLDQSAIDAVLSGDL